MIDRYLFAFVVCAILVGVIFSYSLSSFAVLFYGYGHFHFLIRQLVVGLVGILLMWWVSTKDPDVYLKPLGFILFFGCIAIMLIMPFLPSSLATSAGGARRWIRLSFLSLSPVEFFKIGFVFFLAWSFSRKFSLSFNKNFKEEVLLFIPYILVFLVVVYLIAFLQNDLGQIILLGLVLGILAMFAGGSFKLFMGLVCSALVLFCMVIAVSSHRIMRIKTWWASVQNFALSLLPNDIAQSLRMEDLPEPYQIQHSLNAIANGGFFGEGLGNGLVKLGFLSEVHTDIVLAGIAEELGFVGLIAVSLLFLAIIFRIFKIANRCDNSVNYLFCVGCGMLLSFSFLINAFGISGLTPIKGIAVPFYSYGGSSLLANCLIMGIILSISKKALKN